MNGITQSQQKIIETALAVLTHTGAITQAHRKCLAGELGEAIKETRASRDTILKIERQKEIADGHEAHQVKKDYDGVEFT